MSFELEQPTSSDSEAAGNAAAEDLHGAANNLDDQDHDANSQEQIAEEDEEIEVGDRKFALPKSAAAQLKTERMLQADYTQKTQGVAEERKAVAAERADVARQAKEHQEYAKEMASVIALDDQIAQYNALDWNSIIASDPQQAMQLQQQQKALEHQREAASNSLTQKQQQIALDKQQSFAKQVQDADAYMQREIPGFATGRNDELAKYGAKLGMSPEAIAKAVIKNPVVATLLHKADLYDKLLAKQAPKPPPVAQATPAIKVGSTASVQKDPAKMTDKEFAAWRSSQIRNRK
jgi:hypothetical protein